MIKKATDWYLTLEGVLNDFLGVVMPGIFIALLIAAHILALGCLISGDITCFGGFGSHPRSYDTYGQ